VQEKKRHERSGTHSVRVHQPVQLANVGYLAFVVCVRKITEREGMYPSGPGGISDRFNHFVRQFHGNAVESTADTSRGSAPYCAAEDLPWVTAVTKERRHEARRVRGYGSKINLARSVLGQLPQPCGGNACAHVRRNDSFADKGRKNVKDWAHNSARERGRGALRGDTLLQAVLHNAGWVKGRSRCRAYAR
jgi:hypothetical protein